MDPYLDPCMIGSVPQSASLGTGKKVTGAEQLEPKMGTD